MWLSGNPRFVWRATQPRIYYARLLCAPVMHICKMMLSRPLLYSRLYEKFCTKLLYKKCCTGSSINKMLHSEKCTVKRCTVKRCTAKCCTVNCCTVKCCAEMSQCSDDPFPAWTKPPRATMLSNLGRAMWHSWDGQNSLFTPDDRIDLWGRWPMMHICKVMLYGRFLYSTMYRTCCTRSAVQ